MILIILIIHIISSGNIIDYILQVNSVLLTLDVCIYFTFWWHLNILSDTLHFLPLLCLNVNMFVISAVTEGMCLLRKPFSLVLIDPPSWGRRMAGRSSMSIYKFAIKYTDKVNDKGIKEISILLTIKQQGIGLQTISMKGAEYRNWHQNVQKDLH